MSQEKVANHCVDHEEGIRNYSLNTTFALITCEIGEGRSVMEKMSALKPIIEIQRTMGQYDIIVKCEGLNRTELAEFINKEIRSIKSVRSVIILLPASSA